MCEISALIQKQSKLVQNKQQSEQPTYVINIKNKLRAYIVTP